MVEFKEVKFLDPNSSHENFDSAQKGYFVGLVQDYDILQETVVQITYAAVTDQHGVLRKVPVEYVKFEKTPWERLANALELEGLDRTKIDKVIRQFNGV